MKGILKDLTISRDGSQSLIIAIEGDALEIFDELSGHPVELTLKRWRKRRSLDANAYAWVLIDKIAEASGVSKTEVYWNTIKEIGGVSTTVCVEDRAVDQLRAGWRKNGSGWISDTMPSKIPGCTNVTLYYGSSTYDTAQMARLIDLLIQDAKALGIETLPPAELERLKRLAGEGG